MLRRPAWRSRGLFALAALPVLALLVLHARAYAFLCDDAFISFRYARNLARGLGLVYNPGERVEGYTNFAWVLELAALDRLGVAPPTASWWLSALVTAGVVALAVRLALDPLAAAGSRAAEPEPGRWVRAWVVLAFLAAHRGFAVWSTSGLETRQFTFFALVAWALLARGRPLLAGCALAACELTRPEGGLLFVVAFACSVAASWGAGRAVLRPALSLALPFLLVVGAHYLWRRGYYGEWLPNTYHAKHVRAWPEMGLTYFTGAAIEYGLPLLFSLGALGALARWSLARDARHVVALAWIGAHWTYLIWIGGDHFEFRPLDFHWPLLALAAADGGTVLVRGAARLGRRALPGHEPTVALGAAGVVFALSMVYANAVQVARAAVTYGMRGALHGTPASPPLGEGAFPAAVLVPGLTRWLPVYDAALHECVGRGVAVPWMRHRSFWETQSERWQPYEAVDLDRHLPESAVVCVGPAGVGPYHWGRLTVIDRFGLTDAHVARQPVTRGNDQRYLAHDREIDFDYLLERGENLRLHPLVTTVGQALAEASFALQVGPERWMPFDSNDPGWVQSSFSPGVHVSEPVAYLGTFEDGLDGWVPEGEAFADGPSRAVPMPDDWQPFWRFRTGLVDSGSRGGQASGALRSPPFRAEAGTVLELRLGGDGPRAGVELRAGEQVLRTWKPRSPAPQREAVDLDDWAGATLSLRVFDETDNRRGRVLLDDVVIVRPAPLVAE